MTLNSNLSYISAIILSLLVIFSIFNKAPIVNDKMPITRVELINKNRRIGLVNVSILLLVALVLINKSKIADIIIWTMVIQSMLMFNKEEYKFRVK